jgi:hypothetical protein
LPEDANGVAFRLLGDEGNAMALPDVGLKSRPSDQAKAAIDSVFSYDGGRDLMLGELASLHVAADQQGGVIATIL